MTARHTFEPEIALVLSPDTWVERLHRHCADHGGARVRCIVVEPSVALDEEYHVLVATDRWPAMTRPFVDSLHASGRRVLLVCDDDDEPAARELVGRLGADGIVRASAESAQLVAAVVALVPEPVVGAPRTPADAPSAARDGACNGPRDGARSAALVAVGGPSGAGATEVAIGLAAAGARRGARAVVVDADHVTPSIAARLGLPLEPNLCSAVDAVAFGLGAVPGALFDLGERWPAVLVGAPSRRAADALSAADVRAVTDVLGERYAPVVVDLAAPATAYGPDLAPAILERAGAIVAVGAATPVGVIRLVEWVALIERYVANAPVHLVVNRAATVRSRRAEVASELLASGRAASLTFIPHDARVEDAVWDAGIPERGAFARAAAELLARVGCA
jgi:MinD-like ATPase involved in chromosome partitioning or flagellar assembly